MTTRQQPQTPENEQALLGAILAGDKRTMAVALDNHVDSAWFNTPAHRLVWDAIEAVRDGDKSIDPLTVATQLRAEGNLDAVGSTIALDRMLDACPTAAHVGYYADEVRKAHVARQIIMVARETEAEAYEPAETTDELLSRIASAAQRMGDIASKDARGTVHVGQPLREVMAEWDAATPPRQFCHWPIACMDRHVGRLAGDLVFIAASESVGKTAWAVQMAAANAKYGIQCSFWTGESSAHRIVKRFVSHLGQVSTIPLNQHRAGQEDHARAVNGAAALKTLPIRICDTGMSIDELVTWGKIEVQRGSKMLFVDNTRHIRDGRQRHKSPVEAFRYNSIRLQHLQKDTGVPVIVLHHLTEDGNMSWSKDLQRDADVLVALIEMRDDGGWIEPSALNQYVGRRIVAAEVRKNRDGKRGFSIETVFETPVQTFRDRDADGME